MKFICSLTFREMRSSWQRLIFFFLCIAIGVGAVVALRSLIKNLSFAIGGDAREFLTADIVINSTNPFTPDDLLRIESVIGNSSVIEARDVISEVSVIMRPSDESNETLSFVSLKGIESNFPLVGVFKLSSGKLFDFKMLKNLGVVVTSDLLKELNVKVGDKVQIGEGEFQIRNTFDEVPGGSTGFRLGSLVFVEKKAFDKVGINANRSRVKHKILYRTSDDPAPIVRELREAFKGTTLTVQSYREVQEDLSQQFKRTGDYLSLAGLLIIVLGGIGIWNVSRAFVEQKRRSVAILKCLGATGTRVISVYILNILTLGLIGSFFGIILSQGMLTLISYRFADDLPQNMRYVIQLSIAWQGIALGILVSLLFSALPLLNIRTIKPKLLLRDETGETLKCLDRTKWGIGSASLLGLVILAAWQAGSLKVGVYFLASLSVTAIALYASAALLMFLLKRIKKSGSFSINQAVNSLYRPGNQTRVIILAVGLGAFAILSAQSLKANLLRVFSFSKDWSFPSMFFIDLQKSQIEELKKLIKQKTGEDPETIPTVRARIALINGEPFDFNSQEVRRRQGQIGREFAITYRKDLLKNETIVSGKWWGSTNKSDETEVSIDTRMKRILAVNINDFITFDISGRKVNARIANVRKIDFNNSRTAFAFVFRPGKIEKAPHTFIATILKKQEKKERVQFKRAILSRFPNVQIFDVFDIAVVIQKVVNNFTLAISFVGSFVMLSGMLILIGSVALTKSRRVYENAILKTLGANRKKLVFILFAEYGILGILAGVVGSVFAAILSYLVSEYIFGIEWEFDIVLMLMGVFITWGIVMLVGVAANVDVIFKKPLSILRSQ